MDVRGGGLLSSITMMVAVSAALRSTSDGLVIKNNAIFGFQPDGWCSSAWHLQAAALAEHDRCSSRSSRSCSRALDRKAFHRMPKAAPATHHVQIDGRARHQG